MASPPAKRQRRSTRQHSDDESGHEAVTQPRKDEQKGKSTLKRPTKTQPAPARQAAVAKSPGRKAPAKSTTASPSSAKKAGNSTKEPEKSKSLHTFFSKATEEQRWSRKTDTADEEIEDGEFGDAIVDDDILDDDLEELLDGKSSTKSILDRRKDFASASNGLSSGQRNTPSLSRRFAKPAVPHQKSAQSSDPFSSEETHRPWSDRYGPSNTEELAVHKKKVADVQKWLTDVLSGLDDRRLLILKGPAGSGKSTTVSLLSKSLGVPMISWSNPTAAEFGSTSSVAMQFNEFLNRSGQYGSLDFDESTHAEITSTKRILVVEEFPTNMTRSSAAIDSFRSVVLQYVATSAPALPTAFKQSTLDTHPPVIMIITETLLTSNTAATDSFTAHRLLGPEISNHPLVTITEFNPVAPTFVTRALDLVIKKEARDSKRRRAPGPAVLQRLADMGDIRSAVNSLEFLCVRGDSNGDWSGTVAAKAKKAGKDGVPLTNMEKQSLELVSQREITLNMFHAVGKVVYNKREDPRIRDPRAEPPPKPPDHLKHLNKPKISQVDIEALLNETGTDIQTFLSTLHESCVLSCNGDSFVEAFTACSDYMSDSDILNPDSRALTRSSRYGVGTGIPPLQSGGTDMLRQDEISFQVATRGLLFSLPFPVNRAAHPGGRKQDSFKTFYPASLRLWKPTEETESLIDLFMVAGHDAEQKAITTTTNGVASWQRRSQGAFLYTKGDKAMETEGRTMLPPSRDVLTLTQLPYMAKIKPGNRMLTRITEFHGLNVEVSGEEPFEDDTEPEAPKPSMLARLSQPQSKMMPAPKLPAAPSQEVELERLYLTDDDILDD
jgi:cell cycle checkpoint protein